MSFEEFKEKAKKLGLSDKEINEFKEDSLNIDYQMFYDVLESKRKTRIYEKKDGHIVDSGGENE